MKREWSLDGQWTLYYGDAICHVTFGENKLECVPAQVPGNVELDLSRAGVLPEDLFKGMNPCKAGEFTAKPNHVTPIAKIPIYYSEQRMLLIRWTVNGQTCYNHYMCGFPPFSFEKYKGWLQKLEALESCII